MSDMKFTPGPWAVEIGPGRPEDGTVVEVLSKSGECIADVYVAADSHVADADLIAAAPDLYDALEAMLEADDAEDFEAFSVAIVAARAALAKARGKK